MVLAFVGKYKTNQVRATKKNLLHLIKMQNGSLKSTYNFVKTDKLPSS